MVKMVEEFNAIPQLMLYASFRYLDYGDAEWKLQANEALKSLET